jgi:TolA-binding protein
LRAHPATPDRASPSRGFAHAGVLALLLAVGTGSADAAPDGAAAFQAATALEAAGRANQAADALEALARAHSLDPIAADALFEAAVIAEEKLADPERAARDYAEVVARFPRSRLERRARLRAEFLHAALGSGAGPLKEYQAILDEFAAHHAVAPVTARMEHLLKTHPEFTLTDRALYWLGARYAEARRYDEATARYLAVETRFPGSEWAPRAKKARGDVALERGHLLLARRIYGELAADADPIARAAGTDGRARAASALVRRALSIGFGIYLFLAVALGLRALRTRPLKPSAELIYYAPVAGVFVLAAATENLAIAIATSTIACGGAIVLWLGGALARARSLEARPFSFGERLLGSSAAALAVIAIVYLAIEHTGLTDFVIETLRSGPEP